MKTTVMMALISMAVVQSSAQTFTILHHFGADGDGQQPYSGLAQGPDGALYGTTSVGGGAGVGTIFKINPDGSGYTTLKAFTGGDGSQPEAGVLVVGTNLYGTTSYGGVSNYGTIFRIGTDGSGFSVLRNCVSYDDGVFPASVPALSGTTLHGGINYGKMYRINTDGTGYSFTTVDAVGGEPRSVLLDGSTLYDVEMEGGPSYYDGMVFKVNTDGSGMTILKVMGGDAGSWPNGPLVLSGNTLYGTAYGGGSNYCGTIFKVNTDGSGFSVLRQFSGGDDGSFPYSGMLLCGNVLYGTTGWSQSGVNQGTLFKINLDGTGFTTVKTFSGPDGRIPYGPLLLSGTNLYGTAMHGGALDQGIIFKLSVPAVLPVIVSSPRSQTAEAGSAVTFSAKAAGTSPLTYELFYNGTNLVTASTNRFLTIPDVQPPQAGAYVVVVTNLFGAATSSTASLAVISPVQRRPVPQIDLLGAAGMSARLECADVVKAPQTWLPLQSVSLSGGWQSCFDISDPLPQQRFYRIALVATVKNPVSVKIAGMVPAITLTGQLGQSVRVDAIPAIGPTDAWFTLSTVTLTNLAQLYIDSTVLGQPQRLYRLVAVP